MPRSTSPPVAAALVAALCAVGLASCSKASEGPLSPTPLESRTTGPAMIQSIRIDGPSSLAPDAPAQYTATAQLSDGASRDVTSTTTWRSSDGGVLTIAVGGRAAAGKPGQAVIAAENGGRRASLEVLVLVPGTFRLSGTVSEAGMPVPDALVELLDGSVGVKSTRTDASGVYRLFGVAGAVEIRASKDGYTTQVNRLNVAENTDSDFVLRSTLTESLTGTYTLTLTAAARCPSGNSWALPADVRTRRYTAAVTQDGPRLHVTLGGATLKDGSLSGRIEGNRVTFDIRGVDIYFSYYYYLASAIDLLEEVSPLQSLIASGHVTATASGTRIAGTLSGVVALVANSNHQFTSGCRGEHSFVMERP